MSQRQRKEKIASRLRARVAAEHTEKDLCPMCGSERSYMELVCGHSICIECFTKLVDQKAKLVCTACRGKKIKEPKSGPVLEELIELQNNLGLLLAKPNNFNPHNSEIKRIYGDLKFFSYDIHRFIPFCGQYKTGCNVFVVLEKDVELTEQESTKMLSEVLESAKTMEGSFLERMCKGKIISKEYEIKNDKVGFAGPQQALVVYKVTKRN